MLWFGQTPVPAVDVKIFLLCNVRRARAARCLDIFPHLDPAGRQFVADVAEITGVKLDAIAKLIGCSGVLQITGVTFFHVVILALDAGEIDGLAAASLFVLEDQAQDCGRRTDRSAQASI